VKENKTFLVSINETDQKLHAIDEEHAREMFLNMMRPALFVTEVKEDKLKYPDEGNSEVVRYISEEEALRKTRTLKEVMQEIRDSGEFYGDFEIDREVAVKLFKEADLHPESWEGWDYTSKTTCSECKGGGREPNTQASCDRCGGSGWGIG